MQKITFLFIAFAFSTAVYAQQQSTKQYEEVRQTVINFFEAFSNRDSLTLKQYCTPDIVLIEHGLIWNIDSLITRGIVMNTARDFKRTNKFDFINTHIDGSTGSISYYLHSEITRNGRQSTVQWIETVVLIKVEKNWKIKVLHSTLLKRS